MKRGLFAVIVCLFACVGFCDVSQAKTDITKKEIVKAVKEGRGVVIVPYKLFFLKKKKLKKRKDYNDFEDFLKAESKKLKYKKIRGYVYFLRPNNRSEEVFGKFEKENKYFVLIGEPGEHVLTRFISSDGIVQRSFRIYGKFNIEPGKIKYIGTVQHIQLKQGMVKFDSRMRTVFRPDEFKKEFSQLYPEVLDSLVFEKYRVDIDP